MTMTENLRNGAFEEVDKNNTIISFLRVVRSNDISKFLEFFENGKIEDLNASNANGLTALHLAAKDGFLRICDELLKRGAEVDSVTKKLNTPLHIATLAGQLEVLKMLVSAGANVNARSSHGFTPLYMAAQENHDSCIRYLLANGANPTLATEDGFTPLAVAMQQGHENVVGLLLEAGDGRGKIRLPALHIAAKKDDVKSANLLLDGGNCQPDTISKSGFTPLHIAAHYGNCAIAKILIEKGADVNYKAKHNITPLHVACKWGKIGILQLFLESGSNIDAQTEDGLTPLHCAARSGHDNIIEVLIKHKSTVLSKTRNGLTPLHMAAQGDHAATAKILIENGAEVDLTTVDFLTPLHVASHCGHLKVAQILLANGSNPNAAALNGFTPLHIACKKNRIKIVELLLKANADLSKMTESGLTPLHVASFMGSLNIVIYLLQHEANVNVVTARNETPLHLAVRAGQTDIIKVLLRNGGQINGKCYDDQTPLHLAAKFGSTEICKILLEHGANPDEQNEDGYSPLHLASKEGLNDIVNTLIEHKANVNLQSKKLVTPLHLAVKNGHQKIIETILENTDEINTNDINGVTPLISAAHSSNPNIALFLLNKNASPNIQTKNGVTALHIAAAKNQLELTQKLLERGANANVETVAGTAPLELAAQKGHLDIIKILLKHGAISDHSSKNGLTSLHLCAQEDQVDAAEILLKNKAGIEKQTYDGYTPLHIAAHYGQIRMVKFLIEKKANVNIENNIGYTPLHQAAQQGQTMVISVLLAGKANANAVSKNGYTPLGIAKNLGYVTSVDTLQLVTESILNEEKSEKLNLQLPEAFSSNLISDDEDDDYEKDNENHRDQYKYLGAEKKTYALVEFNAKENYDNLHTVDNVPIQRPPIQAGFLVSFIVDARGGAMKGCRHSGVHVIVPPRSCNQPTRVTCRYVKSQKIQNFPPLMEGEALVSRILELSPTNVKFSRSVIVEIPHFASLRGNEREIFVLKSENGETWKEHPLTSDNDNEDVLETVYHEMFDENESKVSQANIAKIVIHNNFPQYFAVLSRVRQEIFQIGSEGASIFSRTVPEVQAVFPPNALTKKIRVGLQVQPTGDNQASPIITVEPRRRKFHKAIVLHIPAPETDNLRLLCSITGGQNTAIWEDVTGSTPLTFNDNIASFSTTVSARFWLIRGGKNPSEITKIASEMYAKVTAVPFLVKFLVYGKKVEDYVKLSVLCVTDEKEEKNYENQENFREIARSRNLEVFENSKIFLEADFLKANQHSLDFKPFQDNRILLTVKSLHFSNLKFLFDNKIICNLAVSLDKIIEEETSKTSPTRTESDVALHEPGLELSDEDQTEYDFGQTIDQFQYDYVKE